jgi:hypothetical protein
VDEVEQPLVLGEEQLLLVGEVAEEGAPGDLGRLGDLVDGRALEPPLLEQPEGERRWPLSWLVSGCR